MIPDQHSLFLESRVESRVVNLAVRVEELDESELLYQRATRRLLKDVKELRGTIKQQSALLLTINNELVETRTRVNELDRENECVVLKLKAVANKVCKSERKLESRMEDLEGTVRDMADQLKRLSIH